MIRRILRTTAVAAGVALTLAAPASATAQLNGETVFVQYLFPNSSTVFNGNAVNVVVGAGVELAGFPVGDPRSNVDLSDSNILITFLSGGAFNAAGFNGYGFMDLLAGIDPFTSVTINAATNVFGFDASRITFDANSIFVNAQGLSFTTGSVISLDIATGVATVPEPATLALTASGLLLVGAFARRRRAA